MITSRSIEVFRNVDFDCRDAEISTPTVTATSSFPICSEFSADGEFLVHAVFEPTGTGSSLSFVARRKDCHLLIGSLHQDHVDHDLSIETSEYIYKKDISGYTFYALRLAAGNSFGFAVLVQDGEKDVNRQPRLTILRLHRAKARNSIMNETSPSTIEFQSRLDGRGQPLLHYLSGIDFDDAAGLLVLGTSRGDVCLLRFLPTGSWAPGSLRQELPEIEMPYAKVSSSLRYSVVSDQQYLHVILIR